ncbi:MAG: response regulator [Ignavibacteriales bacterium]|nr:response regulator [Ignavibacteriales bacterium]
MDRVKILVVDDSDFLREAIKKFLEDYECDVLVSSDGVSGIQSIVESKPDLVFLDLLLPSINGIDLLKVIKMFDESKDIPVVVITGSKDAYLIKQCIDLGVQKILNKPLTRKGIFNAVEEIIGDRVLSKVKLKKYIGEPEKKKEFEKEHGKHVNANQIKRDLIKFFLKTIDSSKSTILSALEAKNELMLRNIIHQLKGAGSTIGYPRLTMLGDHLEHKIRDRMNEIEWREVEIFSMEVLAVLDLIHDENS